jgi:predicted phage terminase large subunit-like protein
MNGFLSHAAAVQTDREIVEKGQLIDFVEMAWPEIEPSPFVRNWHHEEACEHLEAVSRIEIRNLVYNVPPGCTKSLIVNVLWPAWEWIKRLTTKFIYASFDPTLVGRRDGGKLISLLQSRWFVSRWGKFLTETNPSASDFDTAGGGFRFSTSPNGKGTGRHCNIIVVDDPTKPKDASGGSTVTKKALVSVSEWWSNTMSSRQADPKTHRNVIVMQRVHNADLAGEMLRTGNYVHLCFPMRFVSDLRCQTRWGGDRRTVEGELLFSDRFDEIEVAKLETTMGKTVAEAQLQQRPAVEGGGLYKKADWRFWARSENVPEPCVCERCLKACLIDPSYRNPDHVTGNHCKVMPSVGLDSQSWDMSFKDLDDSDFVAAGVWRTYGGNYYLRDILNERLSFVRTQAAMLRWHRLYPTALDKLVEDKANGTAIIDQLKCDIPGLTPIEPLGGKYARAAAVSPLYAAGKVFLPHPDICPLVWAFISQMEEFPKGIFDDLVDMQSQELLHLRKHGDLFSQAMAALRGNK